MNYITLKNNKKFAYMSEGEGEVLVFIHSFLWDKEMWRPQIDFFKDNFKCISIDLLGHGDSSNLSENAEVYSIKEMSKDVIEVLKELGINKYHYIGLSVGGMLASYIAEDKRAQSMTIMDSYLGKEPLEAKEGYFQLLNSIKKLQFIPEPMVDIITPMFFSPETTQKKTELYLNFYNHLLNLPKEKIDTIVATGFGIFGRDDVLEKLKKITIPTLYLSGEFDIPRPARESKEMSNLTENSKFGVIKGAGHISNLENPESVNNCIKEFLNTVG
ncbi:MAG: alpha/beta hydrolase [Psychrilyobacter sp.]|uniref:alpha/beta fold hydrolase n=1 Tax=Psychrilyobacter sp. TaxID=2586924 RepID=UPI003C78B91D